jgi:hypothetical protein
LGKQKNINHSPGKPSLKKKNKEKFSQFKKGGGTTIISTQSTKVGWTIGQSNLRGSFTRESLKQKVIIYPQYA